MALITGSLTTLGTVATVLFYEPGGVANVTITSDTASTGTFFVGSGTSVTTSNGTAVVPGGSISWATYPGSAGGKAVSAVGAASACTATWLISSAA